MIKVDITGRLTKDTTLNKLPSGLQCCRFSIAARTSRKDNNGKYITEFVNCVAWGKTAEMVVAYAGKGDIVRALGDWQTKTWAKDGTERKDVEVNVRDIEFLSKAKENEQKTTTHLDDLKETDDTDDPFKDKFEQEKLDLDEDEMLPF